VYCPAWWIAGQDEGSSNISGLTNPRMWWHPWIYSHRLPFIHVPAEVKNNLPEETRARLHFGNNLRSGTLEDRGLEEVLHSEERLRNWLAMIAREAMDMEKLPAIQHPEIPLERLRRHWAPGVHPVAEAPLEQWSGYPWNGLFPHPINQPGVSTGSLLHRPPGRRVSEA
jgi:hypothetical protein